MGRLMTCSDILNCNMLFQVWNIDLKIVKFLFLGHSLDEDLEIRRVGRIETGLEPPVSVKLKRTMKWNQDIIIQLHG